MAALERKESERDKRDREGQTLICPSGPGFFSRGSGGTEGHTPLGVSLCPSTAQTPPIWETDQAAFDFEERAAIREYEGGLPRAAAERLARFDLLDTDRQAVAA